MSSKEPFSLSSRLKSFVYAFNGLKTFFRTEHNSWIHLTAATGAVIFGKLLVLNTYEWCLLMIAIGLVIMAEIFNSAIELLTDMISPEYNDMAKKVKDLAAGGVIIAAIVAFFVGVFIFIPKLYSSI
jgi:diacylglycerol kinase (ATP)